MIKSNPELNKNGGEGEVELLRIRTRNKSGIDLYAGKSIVDFLGIGAEDDSLVVLFDPAGFCILFSNRKVAEAIRPMVIDRRAELLKRIRQLKAAEMVAEVVKE